MTMRIIVTAGGTTESIDAVRTIDLTKAEGCKGAELRELLRADISNISKGRFPLAIARALKSRAIAGEAIEVVFLGKEDLLRELRSDAEAPPMTLVPFRSFSDLRKAIESEVSKAPVDLFVMAAAVSDYSPVSFDGKLSSNNEELTIHLRKNPKLLSMLREMLGEQSVLVGFKLLAGVSDDLLKQVAITQSMNARCDFTVANDARRIDWSSGWHPVSLVSAEGALWDLAAKREEVAERLADAFLARVRAKRNA